MRMPRSMIRIHSILLPAALALSSAGAQATKAAPQSPKAPAQQAAPKETPPAPGPAKNFRLPPRKTFSLANGMTVTMVPFGIIPKVTMVLNLRTGVIDEGPNDVTLASVVADMLLEGTTTRSALDISRQAAEMGGSVSASWGSEVSNVSGEALAENASKLAALIADVTLHPKFAPEDLKRIIDKHARDNAIALARPDNVAMKTFREVMYGNHPFARIYPSESMLRGFTVDRVRAFHTTNFSAKRAHLYISGVYDQSAVEKSVRDAFSGWAAGAPPTDNPPKIAAKQQVALIDRPKSVQSAMLMGVAAPSPTSPDWVAMNVADALLGGAFRSEEHTSEL